MVEDHEKIEKKVRDLAFFLDDSNEEYDPSDPFKGIPEDVKDRLIAKIGEIKPVYYD